MPAVLLEEIKYESIGSSPDMDGRGPMKVHALQSFERRTEGNELWCAFYVTRLLTRFNDIIMLRKRHYGFTTAQGDLCPFPSTLNKASLVLLESPIRKTVAQVIIFKAPVGRNCQPSGVVEGNHVEWNLSFVRGGITHPQDVTEISYRVT